MFDVSFSELALILIVSLLVFGPEKLPEVVRTAGFWIGKLRRTFNQVRSEIEREVGVDELKRDFHNHSLMQNLKDVQNDLQQTQRELQQLPYDVSDVVQRSNETPAAHSMVDFEPSRPTPLDPPQTHDSHHNNPQP
ncbi:MAG TPA: Sec-independent protein translocase protein TatB [Spongiibacteraceae bacterium]|jgi:sec-independent protein translocase protein TatB